MIVRVCSQGGGALVFDKDGKLLMVTHLSPPLLAKMRGRGEAKFHASLEGDTLELEDEVR